MRSLKDICVRSLIVHVLDTKSTSGLVKSSRPVRFSPNDRVSQYFATHIGNSLRDNRAVAANFQCAGNHGISPTCDTLLRDSTCLVPGSHLLADRLYEIMARDKRIASGDLAVCAFTAGSTGHVPSYLAIMKLDPSFALWHHTALDERGETYITFQEADNVLPTINEKLQKCAFICAPDAEAHYRLLILDEQAGELPGENVARFFMHRFLNAIPLMDAEIRTEALIGAFRSAQRAVRKMLDEGDRADLELMARAALRRQRIDLDDWVATLPIPDEAKAKVNDVLQEHVPDRVFDIDARVVNSQLPKRKFKGTGGLRVDIPSDLFSSILQRATPRQDQNGRSYVEVVLHTETWEEITRS